MTQTPKLSFSLGGIDSAIFIAPSTLSLSVSTIIPVSETYFELLADTPIGNSITITAKYSQEAVIYWGLTCYGAPFLSFSNLKQATQSLINPSTNATSLSEQLADDYQATETQIDYNKDSDITSFFRRMHGEHCNTLWTNAIINRAENGQTNITLDWLMDGTHYSFFAYADNRIGNASAFQSIDFSTSALQAVYSTSVTFEEDLLEAHSDNIKKILARNIGINPDWFISQGKTNPSRLLQSSIYAKFDYFVIYDRKKSVYSPLFLLSLLDTTKAASELKDLIGISPSSFGTPASASIGTIPSFTSTPVSTSVSDVSATFSATLSQSGVVCVSCTESWNTGTTYAWQVVDGLNYECYEAAGTCVNVGEDLVASILVKKLGPRTSYGCYFTACSSYPTLNYCMDVSVINSTTVNLPMVWIRTEYSYDSGAVIIGILAAFFLIFN